MESDERHQVMDHQRTVEKMLGLIQHAATSEHTMGLKLVRGYAGQAIAHLDTAKKMLARDGTHPQSPSDPA